KTTPNGIAQNRRDLYRRSTIHGNSPYFFRLLEIDVVHVTIVCGASRRPKISAHQINRVGAVHIQSFQSGRALRLRHEDHEFTARHEPTYIAGAAEDGALSSVAIHDPEPAILTQRKKPSVNSFLHSKEGWLARGKLLALRKFGRRESPNTRLSNRHCRSDHRPVPCN